jgi:hypothetical protein
MAYSISVGIGGSSKACREAAQKAEINDIPAKSAIFALTLAISSLSFGVMRRGIEARYLF